MASRRQGVRRVGNEMEQAGATLALLESDLLFYRFDLLSLLGLVVLLLILIQVLQSDLICRQRHVI